MWPLSPQAKHLLPSLRHSRDMCPRVPQLKHIMALLDPVCPRRPLDAPRSPSLFPCSYSFINLANKSLNLSSLIWVRTSSSSSCPTKLTWRVAILPRPNAFRFTAEFCTSSSASCRVTGSFSAAAKAALRWWHPRRNASFARSCSISSSMPGYASETFVNTLSA